jgi:DNA-binding beta-propeller fold protein YncE
MMDREVWPTTIDTVSHTVVETIAVGACAKTVTASPDGTYPYISHYDTRSVLAVNLTTGNVSPVALRGRSASCGVNPG